MRLAQCFAAICALAPPCPHLSAAVTANHHQLESYIFYSGSFLLAALINVRAGMGLVLDYFCEVERRPLTTSFLILFQWTIARLACLTYILHLNVFFMKKKFWEHISDELILFLQNGGSWSGSDGRLLCPVGLPG